MKKSFFLLGILWLCSILSYSQAPSFNNPIENIAKIPQSPEVAAFEKFSGSVNMYTGVPTIAIPIYTIQGNEVSLPISLSYDASGIKVEQIATNVGLGWNLNYGGVVTRNVHGLVDDYITDGGHPARKIDHQNTRDYIDNLAVQGKNIHDVHDTNTKANAALQVYNYYQENEIDLQPDTFSFHVNGLSGTILLDYDDPISTGVYKAYCLENPSIKVEHLAGNGFIVIDTNGHRYTFDTLETTWHSTSPEDHGQGGVDEYYREYVTAWHLTKIESSNKLDIIDFNYVIDPWTADERLKDIQQVELLQISGCGTGNWQSQPSYNLGVDKYKKDQVLLDQIHHNGKEVLKTDLVSGREDLLGVRILRGIDIYDNTLPATANNILLKVDFDNTDYFGDKSNAENKRLKLDGVEIYRDDASDPKKYTFTYIAPAEVPDRKSNGVDFWGYYNGKDSNQSLAADPNDDISDIANYFPDIGYNEISFTNPGDAPGDRTPSFSDTQVGTLESIVFPTGGKSTYTYEEHIVTQQSTAKIVGGLRLKKVTNETRDIVSGENDVLQTHYFYDDLEAHYQDPEITLSTLNTSGLPDTDFSSGVAQQDIIFNVSRVLDDTSCSILYLNTHNRAILVPNNVTYDIVTELRFNDSPSNKFEGCTITEFHNDDYANGDGLAEKTAPFFNIDLEFGEIKKQRVYDDTFRLLSQTENTYITVNEGVPTQKSKVGLIVSADLTSEGGTTGCRVIEPFGLGSEYKYYNVFASLPGSCNVPNTQPILGKSYTHYSNTPGYAYSQYWKKLVSTTTVNKEGTAMQSQTTDYGYFGTNHFMATEISTTDSKGKKSKTEIAYPSDTSLLSGHPNITDGLLSDMVTKNQISTPVQVTQFYEVSAPGPYVEMSQQRRIFDEFTVVNNVDAILPSKVEVSKGSNALEERMEYHSYDAYGNLTEVFYPDGMHHIYIWGYKGQHVLAEIKNASYDNMSTALKNTINAIIADSDVEDNQTNEEEDLRDDLNALRNQSHFANSQISVYTYDPGIGVTSMTDVRGYTTFYYYDQHNRLTHATDEDGNVLSHNQYNLRVNN
tara:strand:+ start:392459 stop:395656 length:3198 start_codon:yes stop_codon:yes gene_type:complete